MQTLVDLFLSGAQRDTLEPIVTSWVAAYLGLDEDGQVDFKGKAKAFARTCEVFDGRIGRRWGYLS